MLWPVVFKVAEVTFNFWYRLSEALFKAQNDAKTAIFRQYFQTLIEALCVHCRLETDAVSSGLYTFVVISSRVLTCPRLLGQRSVSLFQSHMLCSILFNPSNIKTNKKANSFLKIKQFFKSFVIGVRKHNMLKCSKFISPKCILSSMKVGIHG